VLLDPRPVGNRPGSVVRCMVGRHRASLAIRDVSAALRATPDLHLRAMLRGLGVRVRCVAYVSDRAISVALVGLILLTAWKRHRRWSFPSAQSRAPS
jgi:hypothetical protein